MINGKEMNSKIEAEIFGPIIINDKDLRSCFANRHSNNTGEFTAMIEALIYFLYVDKTKRQIELVYDSTLTGDIAQVLWIHPQGTP